MSNPTALKLLRTVRFKNQEAAAEAIGVSRPWYSMVETGKLRPSEDLCKKMEFIFNIPSDKLLKEVSIEDLIKVGD